MNELSFEQNDDEAERAIRRRTLGKTANNASLTNDNLVEEQQGLQNCLKIFHDNKISKENAWTLTLIDNMANLCRGHHKTLKNFQIVGTSLEASTKIYGLRVDSVHSDIVRMSSGLGRMKSDQSNNNEDNKDDTNADANNQSNEGKTPAKRKRIRKAVSTVTKNKDTLNARPDLIQMPDALYFKLNSIMGETSSSNKLLLNILETKSSDLRLTMDDQFWDSKDYEPIQFNADDNYDLSEPHTELPLKISSNSKLTLRQQLSGYTISNTPLDDEDDDEPPAQVDNNSFNMSQCMQEYAFDMAAGIEPIPDTDHYEIDYDMDCDGGNDYDDLSQDDRAAISACKGLRRKTTVIEDLRPSDATKLEYSYRPLDNINQFWAGPSYWKFRKSRKLTMNQASVTSSTDGRPTVQMAHTNKRKGNRSKVEPTKFTKLVESVCEADQDSDDGSFISIESKAAQKFKKTNLYKRWDSKKLKLPTDLHVDRTLFNYYTYCPSISVMKNNPNATPGNETDVDDYDNADDGAYCTDVHNEDNDGMMDQDTDDMMDNLSNVPDVEVRNSEQIPDSQNNHSEQEISHHYEGAPEMVQRIDIQFARRAKVIDMKQMKKVCLNTIERQFEKTASRTFTHSNARMEESYKDGAASFGIIYNSLPHLLSKTMVENLSPSVAFYSILHLANEHRLRLYKSTKENDMNIFFIRQLDK